eukprot:g30628.t1
MGCEGQEEGHVAQDGGGAKSHLFNFTGVSANKAGMGADRKMVADFVYQKSKNSQYTQHQLDLDAKQHARAEQVASELRAAEQRMSDAEKVQDLRSAAAQLEELEKHRDLTDYLERSGLEAEVVVQEMRDKVKASTSLTCSAGIGPNRMVAKIASDERKPDGQTRILPTQEAVLAFMDQLPVRKIPGCGKVLEHQISTMLQISSCRELREQCARVRRAFASRPKTCSFLLRAALGLSGEELSEEGDEVGAQRRKSLSCERTFRAEGQKAELQSRLKDLCRQVAEDMAASVPPLAARVAALKVKTTSFEVRNKQVSVMRGIGFSANATGEDCEAAVLRDFMPCTLRLMGVRVSSFRGQKAHLAKGQHQLQNFFAKAGVTEGWNCKRQD